MPVSPFIFDGPLPPGEVTGRERELAELYERATAGRFVLLYAPRRFGKTSLIHRLAVDAAGRNDLTVVIVDVQGVLTMADLARRLAEAYRALPQPRVRRAVQRALPGLGEAGISLGAGPVRISPPSAGEATPILERLLALPAQISERLGTRMLVVFDEFQAVAEIPNAEAVIRSQIQHQRQWVSYLFSGSEQSLLQAIFARRTQPLYGQAEQIVLGPLAADVAAGFVDDRFRSTGRDPGEALECLVGVTRGHPQRLAFCADALWQRTKAGGTATLETWDQALTDALDRARPEFAAMETLLPVTQRRLLRVLAYDQPPLGSAAADTGLSKGSARGALTTLEGLGIVASHQGSPEIVDPLLAAWLRNRQG